MAKLKKRIIIKNCNYDAMLFCFRKGFRIYPKMFGSKFKIFYVLGTGGQYYMNGKLFTREESWQAVWDLYEKIYKHYKTK
tara:strand:- start:359 stop:598 length:240 start_codon:yes stop_codon:yes gene_type:complete